MKPRSLFPCQLLCLSAADRALSDKSEPLVHPDKSNVQRKSFCVFFSLLRYSACLELQWIRGLNYFKRQAVVFYAPVLPASFFFIWKIIEKCLVLFICHFVFHPFVCSSFCYFVYSALLFVVSFNLTSARIAPLSQVRTLLSMYIGIIWLFVF